MEKKKKELSHARKGYQALKAPGIVNFTIIHTLQ